MASGLEQDSSFLLSFWVGDFYLSKGQMGKKGEQNR